MARRSLTPPPGNPSAPTTTTTTTTSESIADADAAAAVPTNNSSNNKRPRRGFDFRRSVSSPYPTHGAASPTTPPPLSVVVPPGPTTAIGGEASAQAVGVGVGGSAPSSNNDKLRHLVQRIVSRTPSLLDSGNNIHNVQAVTELLLERHREYRRKDLTSVKVAVGRALSSIASSSSSSSSSGAVGGGRRSPTRIPIGGGSRPSSPPSPPKLDRPTSSTSLVGGGGASGAGASDNNNSSLHRPKRKRTYEDAQEAEYERSVVDDERRRVAVEGAAGGGGGGGGSMLNAGLRDRYRDVQRKRDVSERRLASSKQKKLEGEEEASNRTREEKEEGGADDGEEGRSTPPPPNVAEGAASVTGSSMLSAPATPSSPVPPSADAAGSVAAAPPPASSTSAVRKKKKKRSVARSASSSAAANSGGGFDDFGPSPPFGTNRDDLTSPVPRPNERYTDLGGLDSILSQVRELVEYPLSHPELFAHLGVDPPRGVLLRGPPGCGKTHLANAVAGQLGVSYFKIAAPEVIGGVSGESEGRIRSLFASAAAHAPSIVFIDEIDAIAPKRGEGAGSGGGGGGGGGKAMEKRIVAQLLTCLDGLAPQYTANGQPVLVLGATNRPDAIDPALRRAGRFDREILLGVPDEKARESILRVMTASMRLDGDFDYKSLARKTPGFVGADVRSLTKEAAVVAVNRIFRSELMMGAGSGAVGATTASAEGERNLGDGKECGDDGNKNGEAEADVTANGGESNRALSSSAGGGGGGVKGSSGNDHNGDEGGIKSVVPLTPSQLAPLYVTMTDFLAAIPHVQPSSKREGFATVPDVTWDDVGGVQAIREELTLSVLEPISHPEKFEALGLPLPAGVLLYGPPGCGKTLLAKAIARESGANFISVKGPELLDKYVGESERAVRVVFERARSSSPCIVFFDELDSLCPKRGSDGSSGGGGVSERVVNQLLTEMDGLDSRRSVFVIAATNRPELIDPAMMRPGRLDKLLYVPLPSPDDRCSILKALAGKIKLGPDVDLDAIARSPRAVGYSGADCAALLREAGLAVLRDDTLRRRGMLRGTGTVKNEILQEGGSGSANANSSAENAQLHISSKHFDYAFDHVMPSVSRKDQARYDKMRDRMARARTRGGVQEEKASGDGDRNDGTSVVEGAGPTGTSKGTSKGS